MHEGTPASVTMIFGLGCHIAILVIRLYSKASGHVTIKTLTT